MKKLNIPAFSIVMDDFGFEINDSPAFDSICHKLGINPTFVYTKASISYVTVVIIDQKTRDVAILALQQTGDFKILWQGKIENPDSLRSMFKKNLQ